MEDIRTNNVPRDVIDACELTATEREEFDYLDWPAIDEGRDSASFVRFKGDLIDLGNFMRADAGGELAAAGWQGHYATSYFSAYLVKFVNDGEQVIMGEMFS